MKQFLKLALVLCALASALCVSAYAADTSGIYDVQTVAGSNVTVTPVLPAGSASAFKKIGEITSEFYEGAEKLTVTVDSATAAQYLILAQDADAPPSQENIRYVDQDAPTSGSITFPVYPDRLTNGQIYYISIAGTGGARTTVASFRYFSGDDSLVGEPDYIPGDVDGTPGISANDALFVLRVVAHDATLTLTEGALLAADVDGVKGISANDALFILRAVAHDPTVVLQRAVALTADADGAPDLSANDALSIPQTVASGIELSKQ